MFWFGLHYFLFLLLLDGMGAAMLMAPPVLLLRPPTTSNPHPTRPHFLRHHFNIFFFSLRVYFSTMLLSLLSRLLPKSNSPTYSLESFLTHKPTIAYCMYILYLDIKLYLAKKSASCRSGIKAGLGCNKIGSGVGGVNVK